MKENIYIIGAGGHGQVVADAIMGLGSTPKGFLDDDLNLKEVSGIPVIGPIKLAKELEGKFIVAIGDNRTRKKIVEMLDLPDEKYFTVIHSSAIIGRDVKIGAGTMIIGGVVINTKTKVGKHVIVNTSSSLDHHNMVENFVHIAPGTHTGGEVRIEEGSFLGIGTSVLPRINIGKWAKIGAGAVVIRDIPPYSTSVGIPAKIIRREENENTTI